MSQGGVPPSHSFSSRAWFVPSRPGPVFFWWPAAVSFQRSAISFQPGTCALPGDRAVDSPALTRGGLAHSLTVAALTGWLSRVKRSWRSALTPNLREALLAFGPHPSPPPVGEGADTGR